MKLLGWMHRKLNQNKSEPTTNVTTGNPSNCYSARKPFDEQLYHAEATYTFAQSNRPTRICEKFSNKIKGNGIEETFQEESSDELFQGFLAIGTLGSESLNTEPPTPKFPLPFEKVTGKELKITEDELKLIHNELAKFLEAEAKEVADESSARSSQASIITFSNKQLDETDAEDCIGSTACPLQTYLFSSSIELPEMAELPKKEKTSLEELFRRTDTGHEMSTSKNNSIDKQPKRRYASHVMKKILKTLHSTARNCATESEAIKRKLPKIMKIFHRKVYPEELKAKKQFIETDEKKIKKLPSKSSIQFQEDTGNNRSSKKSNLKKKISKSVLSSKRVDSGGMKVNGEHWIKTDAEYLVLEL